LGAALQADGETRSRFRGLKHQKEKRSMDHFAGLDCCSFATICESAFVIGVPLWSGKPAAMNWLNSAIARRGDSA
jgi:hypothetical protein